jgi:A/G-specific adenine glycosylase
MNRKHSKPSKARIQKFQETVLDFYRAHGRVLPWRETQDPYQIWISEVMLQQTQVSRVITKYTEFLRDFPTVEKLAKAELAEVLLHWKGLGYNSRAKNLWKTARLIVDTYRGIFPRDPDTLDSLPGIGPYTARAIATFSFNTRHVFIETNIRAVYLHEFFNGVGKITDADLLPLIEATLPQKNYREWYSALMDYGSELKRLFPNPSRQSAHHTRQTPFKGSRRELRAAILFHLLSHPNDKSVALQKALAKKLPHRKLLAEELDAIYQELLSEGLLGRTIES